MIENLTTSVSDMKLYALSAEFSGDRIHPTSKAFLNSNLSHDLYRTYIEGENALVNSILEVLAQVGVTALEVIIDDARDSGSPLWPIFNSDNAITDDIFLSTTYTDRRTIDSALRFLCRDLGFFTLGSKSQVLIIPFDGLLFHVIVVKDLTILSDGIVCATDESELLQKEQTLVCGLDEVFKL